MYAPHSPPLQTGVMSAPCFSKDNVFVVCLFAVVVQKSPDQGESDADHMERFYKIRDFDWRGLGKVLSLTRCLLTGVSEYLWPRQCTEIACIIIVNYWLLLTVRGLSSLRTPHLHPTWPCDLLWLTGELQDLDYIWAIHSFPLGRGCFVTPLLFFSFSHAHGMSPTGAATLSLVLEWKYMKPTHRWQQMWVKINQRFGGYFCIKM